MMAVVRNGAYARMGDDSLRSDIDSSLLAGARCQASNAGGCLEGGNAAERLPGSNGGGRREAP
jgi:hypothetical protein